MKLLIDCGPRKDILFPLFLVNKSHSLLQPVANGGILPIPGVTHKAGAINVTTIFPA